MADPERLLDRVVTAVVPEVRAADTCGDNPHDGIGRFLDARVRLVFEPDVAGSVDRGGLHGPNPSLSKGGHGRQERQGCHHGRHAPPSPRPAGRGSAGTSGMAVSYTHLTLP